MTVFTIISSLGKLTTYQKANLNTPSIHLAVRFNHIHLIIID